MDTKRCSKCGEEKPVGIMQNSRPDPNNSFITVPQPLTPYDKSEKVAELLSYYNCFNFPFEYE